MASEGVAAPCVVIGALLRHAVDSERQRIGLDGKRLGGQHHPGIFLRARRGGRCALLFERETDRNEHAAIESGFRGERQHAGAVAQPRSVVRPRDEGLLHRGELCGGRCKHRLGTAAVAEESEPRGELRARERGRESVDLGVGEIAQIAHDRAAVARQHIDRIGDRFAVAGRDVGRIGDRIAQMVERLVEPALRHGKAVLARPCQEVGDVGIEPEIVGIGIRRPQAEGPVRILPRHFALDRIADAVVDAAVERQCRAGGELVDIEERHGAR